MDGGDEYSHHHQAEEDIPSSNIDQMAVWTSSYGSAHSLTMLGSIWDLHGVSLPPPPPLSAVASYGRLIDHHHQQQTSSNYLHHQYPLNFPTTAINGDQTVPKLPCCNTNNTATATTSGLQNGFDHLKNRDRCEEEEEEEEEEKHEGYDHTTNASRCVAVKREAVKEGRTKAGQAISSHSLAERVRREKINERMKFLQDLVPGCDKITGKALMLDEIINYVQSLQRQVEFLSMKLATVHPEMEVDVEHF